MSWRHCVAFLASFFILEHVQLIGYTKKLLVIPKGSTQLSDLKVSDVTLACDDIQINAQKIVIYK